MPETPTSLRSSGKPTISPARSEGLRGRLARVAAFTCRETERIGRELGLPLAVIAATSDPERHAARLSATRHAGWSPRTYDDWCLPFDDGFATPQDLTYAQLPFDRRWLGPRALPRGVNLDAGSLVVELPRGASAADLSAVLRAGLADASYDRVARRPDRVRRMYAARRPVVVAPRYSLLVPDDIMRVEAVTDLFSFRPCDLANLATTVSLSLDALVVGAAMSARRRDGCEGRAHA